MRASGRGEAAAYILRLCSVPGLGKAMRGPSVSVCRGEPHERATRLLYGSVFRNVVTLSRPSPPWW